MMTMHIGTFKKTPKPQTSQRALNTRHLILQPNVVSSGEGCGATATLLALPIAPLYSICRREEAGT